MWIRDRLTHKRPVFSFEFFPPKTDKGEANLFRNLERLVPLEPDFVSVTYGAGGSTRSRTLEIISRIRSTFGIEGVAHLTCVGASKAELRDVIHRLGDAGIRNILALRGDPPQGQEAFEMPLDGLQYGSELVAFIKEQGDFCVGAACYPEKHPESPDQDADLRYVKAKVEAGADFLVSQLFFDNTVFLEFCQRAQQAGIAVPILAGVMPVTNVGQIERFTQMCGATLPPSLHERLLECRDDPQEVFWTGVSYSARQCEQLLRPCVTDPYAEPPRGVAGIHFYTLNKSPATRAIFEILKLSRASWA